MSTLTNQQIDQTYQGLLKTTDNAAIGATEKIVTDGVGNDSTLSLGTASASFTGTLDLSGATVTGLAAGGLVSGGQTDSMKSSATLTTTAAETLNQGDIAIGNNARSINSAATNDYTDGGAIAIGVGATVDKKNDASFSNTKGGIAIGTNALAAAELNDGGGVAIGLNASARWSAGVALGNDTSVSGNRGIAIGNESQASQVGVAIGDGAKAQGSGWAIAIGEDAVASVGNFRTGAIAIGSNADATQEHAITIGNNSDATATGAVAIGQNVVAATTDTVSIKALEVQTDSTPTAGGIIMSDAGGTDRRLNIASDGTLQVDSTPVGGILAFSTSRVSETQATSVCDAIRSSVLIPANTFGAGDILQVDSVQTLSGSNGTTYAELWISPVGTVGSFPTGENFAQIHTTSDGTGKFNKTLYINAASGTGGTEFIENGINNEAGLPPTAMQSASVVVAGTIDWTVDQYLVTKVCIDNTGATWTNYGAVIRKIN